MINNKSMNLIVILLNVLFDLFLLFIGGKYIFP